MCLMCILYCSARSNRRIKTDSSDRELRKSTFSGQMYVDNPLFNELTCLSHTRR